MKPIQSGYWPIGWDIPFKRSYKLIQRYVMDEALYGLKPFSAVISAA